MSDPHDHQPDPAALDELQRAFGDDESAEDAAPEQHTDAAPSGEDSSEAVGDDLADQVGGDVADHAAPEDPSEARRREVLNELGIDEDDDLSGDDAPAAEEIFIVEQEPLVDPAPAPPPTVIRIDDFTGDVVESPATPTGSVAASAGTVDPGLDPGLDPGVDPGLDPGFDPGLDPAPAVITIDDDELPDAVYVEGDLDGTGGRTTVFIDDDDTGDAIAPEIDREVRRGIEPRLRERRAAVKRALGRKRLRWLLIGTFVVIVGVGVLAVLGSGLFAIQEDNVTVTGVVYADSSMVDAVVDDLVGTPALLVDVQSAEEDLEAIPWVDQARVRVSFPHSATIEIRERAAMTTYQGPDQRYRVLDRDGRVLAVRDGYPFAYVLITGPDPVDLEPAQFAPQGYGAASELAKNLTDSIRGQVDRIDVTADGTQLIVYLDDGTEVRFGAARDLFDKLLRLETALANNPDREPGVIDVSTSEVTL